MRSEDGRRRPSHSPTAVVMLGAGGRLRGALFKLYWLKKFGVAFNTQPTDQSSQPVEPNERLLNRLDWLEGQAHVEPQATLPQHATTAGKQRRGKNARGATRKRAHDTGGRTGSRQPHSRPHRTIASRPVVFAHLIEDGHAPPSSGSEFRPIVSRPPHATVGLRPFR
jgi:hypothetical protein